ncbi:hypothetical protein BAUCODRAFT_230006 [Baudoinia panamericana UAMH 10762]|uniref:NAD dependent epimerase/dehydratase n=1 Tax=Baudoinia panamericana (strain UAMH 10762) TaxID=717646 RepID=M2MNY9_BAUPA|nr:uncharacterized protein BAUCODRAFT_230006 [Baudoinia panamericana UAMH 10762]EMC93178.1 hypothetical protein BAUCODRAFT_230006 [Baudoinia panamericana UAMH 10762]
MANLTTALQETIYHLPQAPPRIRKTPFKVLCPGPPRSATESLAQALNKLGYSTYHGWDIIFEPNPYHQKALYHLIRRKFCGSAKGDCHITAEEFDVVLGDSDATIDTVAFLFFPELMQAYPDCKVILNTRRDLDAWHASMIQTFLKDVADSWLLWLIHYCSAGSFWMYEGLYGIGFPMFFRSRRSTYLRPGIVQNGKWVYREHCAMVRGMVPRERLLEWSVEDGWGPICEFLGKDVPDEPFPWVNNPKDFGEKVERTLKPRMAAAFRNMVIVVGGFAVAVIAIVFAARRFIAWPARS